MTQSEITVESTSTSHNHLSGYPGHLTEGQEIKLIEFKKRLSSNGFFVESDGEGEKGEVGHDDSYLLRYLRARKFDIEGAITQFESTELWRKNEKVDQVYSNFPVDEMPESQGVYPQWTGRRDKNGLALYIFKVGALSKEATNKYGAAEERINERTIALYELMNRFVIPFTNDLPRPHPESPITATSTIVDISGVSLSRFWNLRDHMSRVSVLASAHYPETLGAIYLIGAPSFFSVVWKWIGKWFDAGTVEKIFILNESEVFKVLSENIPLSSIPQAYGGTLPFTYGETLPILDEEAQTLLGLKEVPRGSIRWNTKKRVLELLGKGRSVEEVERFTSELSAENGEKEKVKLNGAATSGDVGEKVLEVIPAAEVEGDAKLVESLEATTL